MRSPAYVPLGTQAAAHSAPISRSKSLLPLVVKTSTVPRSLVQTSSVLSA